MPCKYHAVKQVCGDYDILLSPGNRYLFPKYRLDTLWLGIKNASNPEQFWEGRTTNKLAVKVTFDKEVRHLFVVVDDTIICKTTKSIITLNGKTGCAFLILVAAIYPLL